MGKTGVVGGGASGLMAAICAAQHGAEVTVLEGRDRIGKKILATGNGKCNFSNRDFLIPRDYRGHHTDLLPRYFSRFSVSLSWRSWRSYFFRFRSSAVWTIWRISADFCRIRPSWLRVE